MFGISWDMIKNKSRQTAAMITLDVQKDITSKGWSCMRSEEEAPYDLIVDMGLDEGNQRKFVTIQVKKDLRTTSRPNGGKGEPVAKNGKDRNSYNYYDEDVTYLSTVNKHGRVVYYHKDTYRYMSSAQLKKANECIFPINDKIQGYRVSVEPIQSCALDQFMG